MPSWIKRIAYWGIGLAAGICALIWVVLVVPFFSDLRRSVVQEFLSEQIGQPLLIQTDVRAFVGATTHVTVSDAVIPSEGIKDLNLAKLRLLEFDIDLISLISGGGPRIDNIRIDGLRVDLRRQKDHTTSWTEPPERADADTSTKPDAGNYESGIISFLKDRTAEVSSVSLRLEDHSTGFEFLFDLQTLNLLQVDGGAAVTVSSQGRVNDQPFKISGDYPRGAMTSTHATIGDIVLNFEGQGIPEEQGGGFAGDLTLDTGEFGDLLEVLKLNGTMEGKGQLSAHLVRQGTRFEVQNIGTVLNFQNGSEITMKGSADDILSSVDFDVVVSGRMFPEDQPPKRAREIKDLELTDFTANLVSTAGAVEVKEVHLKTNYFESKFSEIGPVTVGQVRRTESGSLALEKVVAQIGPRDAPYATASGRIADLLQLKDLDFKGTLNAPASLVLNKFQSDAVQAFGGIDATFEVSDASGKLSLSKLEAHSTNTELWNMKANAVVRTVQSVDGIDFGLDLEVPDGAAFLSALKLKEVKTGPLTFSLAVEGTDSGLDTQAAVGAGQSRVDAQLNTKVDKATRTTVRGSIRSDQVNMEDLSHAIEFGIQLASLSSSSASASGGGTTGSKERKVQPLVLDTPETGGPVEAPAGDGRIVQPLVLGAADNGSSGAEKVARKDGRVVQPLVLDNTSDTVEGITKLVNLEQIGRDLDLEIGIEIAKITGQAGVSSISSALISKDGKADLGPIEFGYGGGYFNVGAQIDFIEKPKLARVSGATGGWDFGKILAAIGVDIKARGKLRANFDLIGNYKSARNFVDSMSGSVTVSMADGAIATSLLDLAGLGLFPWLFSKELQQGYTTIVCVVAPLRIDPGKASSNAVVVETKSVQLVASGSVDWKNDRIAVRAEPRPVGRPLARSAWPFEVTGKLSNPDFKISRKSRQKTERRAQGKNQTSGTRTPCKPDSLQSQ